MNLRSLLVPLAFLALVAGCSKAEAPPTSRATTVAADPMKATLATPASARDLAVTVDLRVSVDHVDDAVSTIRDEVAREGGYLSQATVVGDEGDRSADLEAHVPKSELGALRPIVRSLGDVTTDVETVEDVTEARADVKARLHAARIEEARLLDLMKDHTGKLSEVLESEKELARVRESIERIEAEERTMDGRVTFATVRLHFATHAEPTWTTPGKSIARAGRFGLHAAAAIAVGTGMALAATGPTLVPIALVIAGIVVVARRRARRRLARALAAG